MIEAIFAADTHISDCIWTTHPSIAGDSYYAFQQLVDMAIENKCPLLLAGDVLELMRTNAPTSTTVHMVSAMISRLQAAGIPLYYICGQHDLAEPTWLRAINPWARDVSMQTFEIAKRKWYGIGYQERDALAYIAGLIPEDTYGLLMHQRWREFGGGSNSHGSLADIVESRPSVEVVVTGDLHMMQAKKHNGCLFVSPGATHKRAVSEPDQHFAIAIEDTGRVLSMRLKSRPVVTVVVRDSDHWDRLCARLPASLKAATQIAIDAGVPNQIVTPLLIVEDQGRVGAVADAKYKFGELCHVLAKNSTLERLTTAQASLSDLWSDDQAMAASKDKIGLMVENWSLSQFGPDNPSREILRGLMAGTDIEKLRYTFLEKLKS